MGVQKTRIAVPPAIDAVILLAVDQIDSQEGPEDALLDACEVLEVRTKCSMRLQSIGKQASTSSRTTVRRRFVHSPVAAVVSPDLQGGRRAQGRRSKLREAACESPVITAPPPPHRSAASRHGVASGASTLVGVLRLAIYLVEKHMNNAEIATRRERGSRVISGSRLVLNVVGKAR